MQQHGDGHRADPARNRRDRRGDGFDGGEVDVADHLAGLIAVDADVDDDRAGLDIVGCDHLRLADGNDQDVGLAADCRQVDGAGMGHRDGRVLAQHQLGDRFADDVAAADDDAALALDGQLVSLEHGDDPGRRAGHGAVPAQREQADIDGMEPVDILVRLDRADDRELVDVVRQGQLAEDAVDLAVLVELIDQGQQFELGNRCGQMVAVGSDPRLFTGLFLVVDIDGRTGVLADLDDRQSRPAARLPA